MESKHTPGPLCVHTNDRGFEIHTCADEDGRFVLADCYDEDFANRIVRACNAHDAMVEACEAAFDRIADLDNEQELIDKLDAALAAAKGEA